MQASSIYLSVDKTLGFSGIVRFVDMQVMTSTEAQMFIADIIVCGTKIEIEN